jgi:hypothetical protein
VHVGIPGFAVLLDSFEVKLRIGAADQYPLDIFFGDVPVGLSKSSGIDRSRVDCSSTDSQ